MNVGLAADVSWVVSVEPVDANCTVRCNDRRVDVVGFAFANLTGDRADASEKAAKPVSVATPFSPSVAGAVTPRSNVVPGSRLRGELEDRRALPSPASVPGPPPSR